MNSTNSKSTVDDKNFGYGNIQFIGNSEAGSMTSNLLSNQIMTYMGFFYY